MNRVTHFEIQAENPERAIQFYQAVFGWRFEKAPGADWGYWVIMTAPEDSSEAGINGGLLKRQTPAGPLPQTYGINAYMCTVQVANFDEAAKKIVAAGGTAVTPKIALPGVGWQGDFLDTEGNKFGVHEADPHAA